MDKDKKHDFTVQAEHDNESHEKARGLSIVSLDVWTALAVGLVLLFVLTGFLVGWAGFYQLAVLQPIFFVFLFIVILKKQGLGKQEALFLALIFLFGYGIRTQNIQPGYKYFFGFDSYYHARIIEYLIADGSIPKIDPLGYFELPDSDRLVPTGVTFFWHICAGLFRLFTLFGPYTHALWVEIVKVLPAFFGAFISLLMYFLGKELWGKKAGYMAAFTAAVIPAYVYRTMAGFLEDDALGFFWLVAGLIFLVRALKNPRLDKQHILNALLSGLFFAGMSWSWGFFLVIPIILVFFFPFGTVLFLTRKEIKSPEVVGLLLVSFVLMSFSLLGNTLDNFIGVRAMATLEMLVLALLAVCIGLLAFFSWKKEREFFSLLVLYILSSLVFVLVSFPAKGLSWFGSMLGYVDSAVPFSAGTGVNAIGLFIAIAFVALIAGFFIFLLLFGTKNPKRRASALRMLAIVFLFAIAIATIVIILDPNGIFSSRIVEKGVFMSTVGEEGPGNPHFGYKYGILFAFALISLFAMPAFVFYRKKDYLTPVAFVWVAISLVMAWYKLKFTYHFGLPIAIAAGFCAGAVFYFFRDFKSLESKVVVLGLAFMMLSGLAIGGYFVTQRPPTLDTDPLWSQTLQWMKQNTPPGAKYLNWWSYGHWITFVAGKSVFADNRNVQWVISDGDYAKFLMAQDLNESLALAKKYKPEYVIVDSTMFQQFSSMAVYNFKVRASDLDKNTYIRNLLMFAQPARPGTQPFANFYYPCHETDQNSYVCRGRFASYQIKKENFSTIASTWSKIPTEQEEGIPVWTYRDENNSGLARFLSTVNNSTLAKLWFHDSEAMKYFEEVYRKDDSSKAIKIFKVKEEAFGWK